jgi:hypothetical protein
MIRARVRLRTSKRRRSEEQQPARTEEEAGGASSSSSAARRDDVSLVELAPRSRAGGDRLMMRSCCCSSSFSHLSENERAPAQHGRQKTEDDGRNPRAHTTHARLSAPRLAPAQGKAMMRLLLFVAQRSEGRSRLNTMHREKCGAERRGRPRNCSIGGGTCVFAGWARRGRERATPSTRGGSRAARWWWEVISP